MIVFKKAKDLQVWINAQKKKKLSVGFVPTMGALHNGHVSLIHNCKQKCDVCVISIFVNPAQFNNKLDFEKYPSTIEEDLLQAEKNGCDALFLPSILEVYPKEFEANKKYNLGTIDTILEGACRPGHFQGVCLVVERLLNIVEPNFIFLGQKDYQQCMVITQLIKLMHKQETIKIIVCSTLREKNGLAMSSRNVRLSENEKNRAACIYKALEFIKNNLDKSKINELKLKAQAMILNEGLQAEYIEIVNAQTLEMAKEDKKEKLVALIAAFCGEVRLIDNIVL